MTLLRSFYDFDAEQGSSTFPQDLQLKNLGLSIRSFKPGEGFDFYHNHREQEEIYLCLKGEATIKTLVNDKKEVHVLKAGEAVKVCPDILRVIGNHSDASCTILISGACPHDYPSGVGHHDVIADVKEITGQGETGFSLPKEIAQVSGLKDDDC